MLTRSFPPPLLCMHKTRSAHRDTAVYLQTSRVLLMKEWGKTKCINSHTRAHTRAEWNNPNDSPVQVNPTDRRQTEARICAALQRTKGRGWNGIVAFFSSFFFLFSLFLVFKIYLGMNKKKKRKCFVRASFLAARGALSVSRAQSLDSEWRRYCIRAPPSSSLPPLLSSPFLTLTPLRPSVRLLLLFLLLFCVTAARAALTNSALQDHVAGARAANKPPNRLNLAQVSGQRKKPQ